ncbi:hypothetical protein DV737_g4306, partial [Chaetothyriales sp. CBS 132003]
MGTRSPVPEIGLAKPHATDALDPEEMVVQSVRSAVRSKASNQPLNFQSTPGEPVPICNNGVNSISRLLVPDSTGSLSPTFAQRLHVEALRAGLQLVCTAEDRSLDFYRVFNHVLDTTTRERFRALMSRSLDNSFSYLLQPPPESDVDSSWSGGLSCAWLNASDVARYFRSIGMDFDGSQDVVTIKIHPGSFPAGLVNAQGQHAASRMRLSNDGLEKSTYQQQQPHDEARFSSTVHHTFTTTALDMSSFGILAKDIAYTTRSHDAFRVSIDVSKLIHG